MLDDLLDAKAADVLEPSSEPRLRVLLIADSCNPEWESIPLEGWSHARALSRLADVHIVTRNWNAPALTRAGLVEGRDFTAIDTNWLFGPMQSFVRLVSGPNKGHALLQGLSIPSYVLLEYLAWRKFRKTLCQGAFDIVHRLTPLSPAVPSLLASLCKRIGVPFVIGPINGGLPWPAGFPGLSRREGEWATRLRELHRWIPFYRSTRESASAIIVGSAGAKADLPARWHGKACYVPENGIDLTRFPIPAPRSVALPLRAVFLGRLVPYKGADMLIEAASEMLSAGMLTLDIIGDGPERASLEAQVDRLGVRSAVSFAGWVKHTELSQRLEQAHLLTFPSVREFGGAVVLEAMACGVVPVVVDYGGPGELMTPATGFAVKLSHRQGVVDELRAILRGLVDDPSQLPSMARCARQRARQLFDWDSKAAQTFEVYRWVTGHRSDRPDSDIPLSDDLWTVRD